MTPASPRRRGGESESPPVPGAGCTVRPVGAAAPLGSFPVMDAAHVGRRSATTSPGPSRPSPGDHRRAPSGLREMQAGSERIAAGLQAGVRLATTSRR